MKLFSPDKAHWYQPDGVPLHTVLSAKGEPHRPPVFSPRNTRNTRMKMEAPHPSPLPSKGRGGFFLGHFSQGGSAFALGYISLAPMGLPFEPGYPGRHTKNYKL
jgi:hypothetical protein